MACYLIIQVGGQKISDEHKCLFPCFENLRNGGASYKVHKAMKSCIGHISGMNLELTPSGIPVSIADQMSQHPILNIAGAIVRGGWSFEGESRLFYYIAKILHVSQAGLVLGNHADPK